MKKLFQSFFRAEKQRDLIKYLRAQLNAIDKSKYIESEKERRDLALDFRGNPSEEFYIRWIQKHGPGFRNAWIASLCRKCGRIIECKDCLRNECEDFIPEPKSDTGFFRFIKYLSEKETPSCTAMTAIKKGS